MVKKISGQTHFQTAESKSKEKAHHSTLLYGNRNRRKKPNNLSVPDFVLEYIVLADLIELEAIQNRK